MSFIRQQLTANGQFSINVIPVSHFLIVLSDMSIRHAWIFSIKSRLSEPSRSHRNVCSATHIELAAPSKHKRTKREKKPIWRQGKYEILCILRTKKWDWNGKIRFACRRHIHFCFFIFVFSSSVSTHTATKVCRMFVATFASLSFRMTANAGSDDVRFRYVILASAAHPRRAHLFLSRSAAFFVRDTKHTFTTV